MHAIPEHFWSEVPSLRVDISSVWPLPLPFYLYEYEWVQTCANKCEWLLSFTMQYNMQHSICENNAENLLYIMQEKELLKNTEQQQSSGFNSWNFDSQGWKSEVHSGSKNQCSWINLAVCPAKPISNEAPVLVRFNITLDTIQQEVDLACSRATYTKPTLRHYWYTFQGTQKANRLYTLSTHLCIIDMACCFCICK